MIRLRFTSSFIQILTFDELGISQHPNHVATYKGVLLALPKLKIINPNILGLKLDSTSLFRKFCGILDILISMILGSYMVINFNIVFIYIGMTMHQSQFVWYRRLFVIFSRYSFVNTYSKMRYLNNG